MEGGISLAFATVVGFGHAFEADHLLAMSTMVSKAKSNKQLATSGFFWGLGHTSTILFVGILLIILQINTLKAYFEYFEILVAFMLMFLGIFRLVQLNKSQVEGPGHSHDREAYGIGLIHGLAGSGALILLVLTDLNSNTEALAYLGLFGLGSALGMSVAASLLSLPLFGNKSKSQRKQIFTWTSSLLCIGYGIYILLRYI